MKEKLIIKESQLKDILREAITVMLTEHRNIVYELDTAIDIIQKQWTSPDDTWWVKIESRLKDHVHYNQNHGYNRGDRGEKRWNRLSGNDSIDGTHRENHVGYVIVQGNTMEECIDSLKNAVVHLNPWAAKIMKRQLVGSQGHMEGIIKVCNHFFARAYMNISKHSMNMAIGAARNDKSKGLFVDKNSGYDRTFHHRIGQAKSGNDGTYNWDKIRPWGMIDCDIDDAQGQKELEDYLAKNNIQPVKTYLSHDGKHYIFNSRDAGRLNYDFLKKYNSRNRPNDPNCEFKGDANMILYSATGI